MEIACRWRDPAAGRMMNEDQTSLDSGAAIEVTVLSEVKVGGSGVLERLDLPDEVSDHLAHLGFLPGASFEVLRRAPAGDPTVYRIDGVEVGLRNETARHIVIETASTPLDETSAGRNEGRS